MKTEKTELGNEKAALSKGGVIKSVFLPSDLIVEFSHNFKQRKSRSSMYDYEFEVVANGDYVGDLYYDSTGGEWCFLKDNFPFQRRTYRISFPIRNAKIFAELFSFVGVSLLTAETV